MQHRRIAADPRQVWKGWEGMRTHAMPATVLVIEDEHLLNATIREILVDAGYRVLSAYNGVEGLTRLDEQKVDLIICDETLPKLTGIDLCNQLEHHSTYQTIPIILTSGYATPSRKARHYSAFLPKPFDMDQLLAAVESVLAPST
jgi:DNA-binding response OmpR family regulator